MTWKLLGAAAMAVSLAACDTATTATNTVASGASAVGTSVASGATAVGSAVTTAVTPAPAVAAAPVATTKTHHATTYKGKKVAKGKHVKTPASQQAGDGAYMGGGMVVTTPVGTGVGTGTGTAVGRTIPVAPGTPMTVPSGVAVPAPK